MSQNDPHRAPAQATGPADHAVVGGMSRRTQILRLLLRYRGSGVFAGMHLDPAAINEYEVPAEGTPDQFVSDLESLGPTFVKLGQMLSTRPDIVPPEFATALERMQENTSSVPVEHIRQIIEEELGVSVNKAFLHFDPVPLGCASLAQVHRAALRDGTPVAIKVQKPEVAAQVRSDMDVLKSFATAADRLTGIGRRVRFADWLGEFGKTLRAELNYQDEAETLVRFGKHLKPFPQLWVPQPIWDLSSRRVLTMQLAEGARVDKISGLRRTEQPMDGLAAELVKGYLDQMFVHGEIHADPHPGNLRVLQDGRLAIFDLGMVAHVPPRLRERLLKLLFAAVDGRGEEVAEETIALSTRLEDYDEERYQRETGQMIARYAAHDATSEGRVVLDLVRIATSTGLRTPPELSLIGKTLLNLEGVCRALSPTLDTRRIVERHLQHVMRARLKIHVRRQPGQRGDGTAASGARRPAPHVGDSVASCGKPPADARHRAGRIASDGKPAENRQPRCSGHRHCCADPGIGADDAHRNRLEVVGISRDRDGAIPAWRCAGAGHRGQCAAVRPPRACARRAWASLVSKDGGSTVDGQLVRWEREPARIRRVQSSALARLPACDRRWETIWQG